MADMKVLVFNCRKLLEINCRKLLDFTCFLQFEDDQIRLIVKNQDGFLKFDNEIN